MRRLSALSGILLGLAALPAFACAVPTRIEVRNETPQQLRLLSISDDTQAPFTDSRVNILPPDGLAPGQAITLNMPSCMGLYVMSATLADGTVRRYPGLDARRIIGLSVR